MRLNERQSGQTIIRRYEIIGCLPAFRFTSTARPSKLRKVAANKKKNQCASHWIVYRWWMAIAAQTRISTPVAIVEMFSRNQAKILTATKRAATPMQIARKIAIWNISFLYIFCGFVGLGGIEPPTVWLKANCSTIWAKVPKSLHICWQRWTRTTIVRINSPRHDHCAICQKRPDFMEGNQETLGNWETCGFICLLLGPSAETHDLSWHSQHKVQPVKVGNVCGCHPLLADVPRFILCVMVWQAPNWPSNGKSGSYVPARPNPPN